MPDSSKNGVVMYSTGVKSPLVIQITGSTGKYIAEVTSETPLRLKVEEVGPYANLKDGDFIILEDASTRIQDVVMSEQLLREQCASGKPLLSGLASLGITDRKMYEILPDDPL